MAYEGIHVYNVYMSVQCGILSEGAMTDPALAIMARSLGLEDWVSLSPDITNNEGTFCRGGEPQ